MSIRTKQSGVTLIELMITLVVALVLIGGLASTFLSSRQGVKLQQGIAITNDVARAALEFIGHDVQMAGYQADVLAGDIDSVIPGSSTEGGTGPDAIGVQYETDRDCRGAATPTYADGNRYARNVYLISGGALVCRSLDAAGTATEIELVDNVEDLQVLYGENTDDSDGEGIPDVYVRRDRVTDWNNVVAAQVAIRVASAAETITNPIAGTVNLLNQGETTTPADGRYRTVLSSTFLIRNRLE